jgi:hypothetical protein
VTPETRPDAKEITCLVKDSGRVTGYKLSDGKTLTKEEGVSLAKDGGIKGVGVATRKGNEYLRTLPETDEATQLSKLPSVSQ